MESLQKKEADATVKFAKTRTKKGIEA